MSNTQIKDELLEWASKTPFNTAITLTTPYPVTTVVDIEKIYATFLHRINTKVNSRAYRESHISMYNFAVYEDNIDAGTGERKYHIHACIERPHYKTVDEFRTDIDTIWIKMTKPIKSIVYTDVQEIVSGGWLNYCTKHIYNLHSSSHVSSHANLCAVTD